MEARDLMRAIKMEVVLLEYSRRVASGASQQVRTGWKAQNRCSQLEKHHQRGYLIHNRTTLSSIGYGQSGGFDG